ncbi:MAG TPA: tryptophan 2,3-dioxygenase family protein [Gemmatimonadaceae bacterium]|nr:tryptophan 2,3-dioxygenase family protein [Gemmatimonadaceae bacterium]
MSGGGAHDELTYGSYLQLDALLALQQPRSQPEHPDELLFIVVHQASELWFKVILHELARLVERLEQRDAAGALFVLRRVNSLVQVVTAQLAALDTLPPQRFAEFRGLLGSSSGSQSVQFRAIEAASGLRDPVFLQAVRESAPVDPVVQRWLERATVQELFVRLLDEQGVSLDALFAAREPSVLTMLGDELLAYEQGFGRWRFLHTQLVERILGPSTPGTGGTQGASFLARTVSQRFFPRLWEARSRVFGAGAP